MSPRARRVALASGVAAGAAVVYFFRGQLDEPRRAVGALIAVAFFWAPESDEPLRGRWWLLAAAMTAWGTRTAGLGAGGFPLWAACSAAGAVLAVRGGSRAARYLLPEALGEEAERKRRTVRLQLQLAVAFFLTACLVPGTGPFAVFVAAAFFVRYALLQSKLLDVPPVALSKSTGIVPAQKWLVLLFFLFVAGTPYLDSLLGPEGGGRGGEGRVVLTAALCMVLAALIFVLALVRCGWPRAFVRRVSFFAGIGLAVALTAVLARLESWNVERYGVLTSAVVFFLVVLPFLESTTRLFDLYPRAGFLVPPAILGAMSAPLTAVGGSVGPPPSGGVLFAFALLMLVYELVVALRLRAAGTLYLSAAIGATLFLSVCSRPGGPWKIFLVSVGLLLYAVDLFDRVWRKCQPHERIETA